MATMVHTVNVIDQSRLTPPSGSVAETSLPLTFFDVPWLGVHAGSDIAMGDDDDDGFVAACKGISRAIQRLDGNDDDGVLGGSDRWFRRLLSILASGERIITVAGSPKLGVYDIDFGFGRPRKVEVISIEETGAISLAESRDDAGRGIEVGLALPKHEMEQFTYYYEKGLKNH
ncbi:hypothetical protein AAC387_Pa01g0097 [Persea americana]